MAVLDSLPSRITGAITAVIALLILLQQADQVTSHLNGLYLQLATSGYCLTAGEPFDRLTTVDFKSNASYSWAGLTEITDPAFASVVGNEWTKLLHGNAGACEYDTTAPSMNSWVVAVYTPQGTSIRMGHLNKTITEKKPSAANNTSITQTDGYIERSSFLAKYSEISILLANLFGLGIPVGLMLMMGGAGAIFVDRLIQGNTDAIDGRIGQIVVLIAMVIIATIVFGLLTGGIQAAFDSIDPARFRMYDNVIGRVASTAIGFWGILLVAGLLPVGFALFRGRSNLGG